MADTLAAGTLAGARHLSPLTGAVRSLESAAQLEGDEVTPTPALSPQPPALNPKLIPNPNLNPQPYPSS